jgi:type IV pilus assembly protein PilQ
MRNVKKVVSTGCFFLCVGGWVYSGQQNAAAQGVQAREAVLNAAVAQAASGSGTSAVTAAKDVAGDINNQSTADAAAIKAESPTALANAAPASAEQTASQTKPTDLSAAMVNVGVDGKVEQINMSQMDINTALHFLSLQAKRNIIASKDVKGEVTVNLYNVTFNEALDAMLKPNGFDYIEKGNFIYVYTAKELEEMRKRDMHTENRIFRLKYLTAADASVLLKPLMSSNGAMALTPAAAGGIDTTATGGNSYSTDDTLVVSDYPGNLNEMAAALVQIDVRPKQVLIEATILDASLNDTNALGIDLLSVSGVDFSNLTSAALTNNTSASASGTTTGGTSGATALNGPAGIINNFTGTNNQTNVSTDFASHVPQGGLSIGFLSNHFAIFMRALEEVTDTTIVANPKILALNKQRGEVHIGQKLGYLTTTTSATTTNQTVQFMDVGTKLEFRPFIHEDGHISMEIHPEDSSGFIDTKGIPQTTTTEVTSTVDILDGHTIVIGGLFSENTTAAKGQVPILGNIPILGVPFRRTNDSTLRQETIVLITPHIINDDESYYEESLREAEDVTRIQLGNRADLQPWGRDRIAHIWYVKAEEEFQAGNKDKALMYTDWSLNTNPRLLESIKLREQITSRKMDEMKGSSVSELVKNVLSGDAATTPDKSGSGNYPPATPTTAPASMPAK